MVFSGDWAANGCSDGAPLLCWSKLECVSCLKSLYFKTSRPMTKVSTTAAKKNNHLRLPPTGAADSRGASIISIGSSTLVISTLTPKRLAPPPR